MFGHLVSAVPRVMPGFISEKVSSCLQKNADFPPNSRGLGSDSLTVACWRPHSAPLCAMDTSGAVGPAGLQAQR